jgi:hypothetical protein
MIEVFAEWLQTDRAIVQNMIGKLARPGSVARAGMGQ